MLYIHTYTHSLLFLAAVFFVLFVSFLVTSTFSTGLSVGSRCVLLCVFVSSVLFFLPPSFALHCGMASTAQRGDTVTLQFGRFSNYVGAHFWNLQDELIGALSQDVDDARGVDVSGLYRASSSSSSHSQSAAGVTYTPRALIYDLRSSLGSLLSADYSQGDATTAAPKPDPRVRSE